jgi:outer membrane protein assembly factor BamD (BamD/ComL family)
MYFMKKRLVRLLEPLVKGKLARKYAAAASRIQRMFRRYRDRKMQFEALKRKNELRKKLVL